jgi:hypothetical protein
MQSKIVSGKQKKSAVASRQQPGNKADGTQQQKAQNKK